MIYEWNWIYMNGPSNGYYIMHKGPTIHHEIAYYYFAIVTYSYGFLMLHYQSVNLTGAVDNN